MLARTLLANSNCMEAEASTAPEWASCVAMVETLVACMLPRMKRRVSMQWTPTSPMGPPAARVGSVIQGRRENCAA